MDQRKHGLKPALMAATAVFALLLVTPATAQIVIGGDGNSSVTVNMDVLDGGPRGRLTTPGSDGRILLMPNAPREGQERIVLKPPASMRGAAQPAAPASSAPALAAAPQLTPPASMRNTARPAAPTVTPPTAPAVRAPTALQPQKPEAPKVAAPQIAAPKPAETPKPAAPTASTEKTAAHRRPAFGQTRTGDAAPPRRRKQRRKRSPSPRRRPRLRPRPRQGPPSSAFAALPPQSSAPSQPAPAGITRLAFGFNQAEMDEAARTQLQAVAKRLQDNESLRVQLLAYAGGEGVSSSQARRLSLSRALAVRSQLIEQGIRSTRMDVRALGDTDKDGPADRVDIRIVDR